MLCNNFNFICGKYATLKVSLINSNSYPIANCLLTISCLSFDFFCKTFVVIVKSSIFATNYFITKTETMNNLMKLS